MNWYYAGDLAINDGYVYAAVRKSSYYKTVKSTTILKKKKNRLQKWSSLLIKMLHL